MKRITLCFLIISAVLTFPPILRSKAVYEVTGSDTTTHFPVTVASPAMSSTPQGVDGYIRQEAAQFDINPNFASCIVSHESQDTDRTGDDGNSRGYWQISKIWHPEVADSCADSLECSTDWSLAWIKAGHAKQWSTFWLYCSSTPIFVP